MPNTERPRYLDSMAFNIGEHLDRARGAKPYNTAAARYFKSLSLSELDRQITKHAGLIALREMGQTRGVAHSLIVVIVDRLRDLPAEHESRSEWRTLGRRAIKLAELLSGAAVSLPCAGG